MNHSLCLNQYPQRFARESSISTTRDGYCSAIGMGMSPAYGHRQGNTALLLYYYCLRFRLLPTGQRLWSLVPRARFGRGLGAPVRLRSGVGRPSPVAVGAWVPRACYGRGLGAPGPLRSGPGVPQLLAFEAI